ncbi:hypothetical protein BDQ94DRAFT_163103 [Aspergillus welwitschiae]|uniref:Zn(2)-C6 fungal-type domain-containing protein n=1 Tax=Aspergillus welwitschiae TaxID=1341132 RepID=A0A3F3PMC3_9EURO|nr:hypothetical protein BDQ94DRAFT_163103 [Aspergillus welwitschiae]RDH28069.1 hypothetical protein BDQ94DRAFT_163103 [Aspergillus welwitschiae]
MMVNVLGSNPSQASGRGAVSTRRNNETGDAQGPPKKQRRQRPSLSCAECRRLKMKCDRQVPCSNCVRRRRAPFCNPGITGQTPPRRESEVHQRPRQAAGHDQPSQSPDGITRLSPATHESGPHHIQRWDVLPQHGLPQHHNHGQAIVAAPGSADARGRNLGPQQSGRRDEQLALLAHVLQSDSLQNSPSMATSRIPLADHSVSKDTGLQNSVAQPVGVGEQSGSYGTLMLGKGGRSKYLGPTAGSKWLKESETQDISDSPPVTRAPSPKIAQEPVRSRPGRLTPGTAPIAFPFNVAASHVSTRELLSRLPPREEAETLVASYYRYCAWHHDVAPRATFDKTFDRVYASSSGTSLSPNVNPQEIALVFIILAQGTMFNIEMPNYDPSTEDWLHLSELALVKGRFLSNNMVAGLQTLEPPRCVILHAENWSRQLDKGGRGDNSWPLWGLVMRLVQAMGMHRDGTRWNLSQDVIQERRKVFWELNAADTFQAHCFSRPYRTPPPPPPRPHCDVEFPAEPLHASREKSYSRLRFELSQLSSEILNMAMKVRKPPYSAVTDLDVRLADFERNLPFSLRCRAAFLSMPSRYPHVQAAIEASPEPSPRSMTISFQQQSNLALNISETIINLHRPYYAKALYDINERTKSIYAPSFLTVIERCGIIIAIVDDIHTRFPAVSTRQWNFWVGQSTPFHGANTPRYCRNLQWLSKLRARASSKIATVSTATQQVDSQRDQGDPDGQEIGREDREDSEDVELLGWRTRLIERAGQGRPTIRTIQLAETPTDAYESLNVSNASPHGHPQGELGIGNNIMMPGSSLPMVTPDSTNDLLQDFWDPMLLQDILGGIPVE